MGGFGRERCFEMDRPTKMPSAPFSPRGGWDQLAAGTFDCLEDVDSRRPECANTGHCRAACRTGQFDPGAPVPGRSYEQAVCARLRT
jgi:hypothetical protein